MGTCNTDYKQGAKMVQDIREGSQDWVCKVQTKMLCHRVELSGTLLVLQSTKSVVSIGCRNHYKSLREIAAVTYNSDICSKNFLHSLIIFIVICDVSSSLF